MASHLASLVEKQFWMIEIENIRKCQLFNKSLLFSHSSPWNLVKVIWKTALGVWQRMDLS